MGIAWKLALGAAALGLIALVAKGKAVYDRFTFELVGVGIPKLNKWVLSVPLTIEFQNPLPNSIPLDRFEVDFFLQQKAGWDRIGRIDQPLIIDPGISQKIITPSIDLKAFFANNFLLTLESVLTTQTIRIRADVVVTAPGGIQLPKQSKIFDVNVPIDAVA